jgi:hypothetical protein
MTRIGTKVAGKQKDQRVNVVDEKQLQAHVSQVDYQRTHRNDDKRACRK